MINLPDIPWFYVGAWALDMAKEFPHADVLGIDLVPTNLPA